MQDIFCRRVLAGSRRHRRRAGVAAETALPDTVLRPVTVHPPPHSRSTNSAPASPNASTSTENGARPPLDCANQNFKQQVDQINPSLTSPSAPLDARSPDTKIDIANVPAVQQQYGQNFGVSAIPCRPPPLIYTSPLGHH